MVVAGGGDGHHHPPLPLAGVSIVMERGCQQKSHGVGRVVVAGGGDGHLANRLRGVCRARRQLRPATVVSVCRGCGRIETPELKTPGGAAERPVPAVHERMDASGRGQRLGRALSHPELVDKPGN